MIVGIVNQSDPTGVKPVEEFRVGATPADAVAAFAAEYNPPLVVADYLGIATGWSTPELPTPGSVWAWDFDVGALTSSPPELVAAKNLKLEKIDRRTEELITAGFVHAGKQFSLSQNAQIKWMGAYTLRSYFTTLGIYPITVNTKDDMDSHDVADEAEVAAIWQAVGISTLTILGGDATLKAEVRAATTVAAVAAVVDSR